MFRASMYLLVFIQIILVHLAEKMLLLQPLIFFGGGDYQVIDREPLWIFAAPTYK